MMTCKDVKPAEFHPYYGRYINKLSTNLGLIQSFELGKTNVENFFTAIPVERLGFRYAENKWNCKEILQHLIDTERIFMYRCFRIARNDKTELAGFDQNRYIEPSGANKKSMKELLKEFQFVRESSISLLKSLGEENLKNVGNANGVPMSARTAAFTVTGHEIWHMEIISEKYL